MRLTLRTRIAAAILAAVLVTDALAIWAVNNRIQTGARRESATQTRAQSARMQELYRQRAQTLAAEGEAVSFYPAVIQALADGNAKPLLAWSGQLAAQQQLYVTVVDAKGTVI